MFLERSGGSEPWQWIRLYTNRIAIHYVIPDCDIKSFRKHCQNINYTNAHVLENAAFEKRISVCSENHDICYWFQYTLKNKF